MPPFGSVWNLCVYTETAPVGSHDDEGDGSGDVGRGANTAARDNKHNLAQREQYYATIRKSAPRDQQSDLIPGELYVL